MANEILFAAQEIKQVKFYLQLPNVLEQDASDTLPVLPIELTKINDNKFYQTDFDDYLLAYNIFKKLFEEFEYQNESQKSEEITYAQVKDKISKFHFELKYNTFFNEQDSFTSEIHLKEFIRDSMDEDCSEQKDESFPEDEIFSLEKKDNSQIDFNSVENSLMGPQHSVEKIEENIVKNPKKKRRKKKKKQKDESDSVKNVNIEHKESNDKQTTSSNKGSIEVPDINLSNPLPNPFTHPKQYKLHTEKKYKEIQEKVSSIEALFKNTKIEKVDEQGKYKMSNNWMQENKPVPNAKKVRNKSPNWPTRCEQKVTTPLIKQNSLESEKTPEIPSKKETSSFTESVYRYLQRLKKLRSLSGTGISDNPQPSSSEKISKVQAESSKNTRLKNFLRNLDVHSLSRMLSITDDTKACQFIMKVYQGMRQKNFNGFTVHKKYTTIRQIFEEKNFLVNNINEYCFFTRIKFEQTNSILNDCNKQLFYLSLQAEKKLLDMIFFSSHFESFDTITQCKDPENIDLEEFFAIADIISNEACIFSVSDQFLDENSGKIQLNQIESSVDYHKMITIGELIINTIEQSLLTKIEHVMFYQLNYQPAYEAFLYKKKLEQDIMQLYNGVEEPRGFPTKLLDGHKDFSLSFETLFLKQPAFKRNFIVTILNNIFNKRRNQNGLTNQINDKSTLDLQKIITRGEYSYGNYFKNSNEPSTSDSNSISYMQLKTTPEPSKFIACSFEMYQNIYFESINKTYNEIIERIHEDKNIYWRNEQLMVAYQIEYVQKFGKADLFCLQDNQNRYIEYFEKNIYNYDFLIDTFYQSINQAATVHGYFKMHFGKFIIRTLLDDFNVEQILSLKSQKQNILDTFNTNFGDYFKFNDLPQPDVEKPIYIKSTINFLNNTYDTQEQFNKLNNKVLETTSQTQEQFDILDLEKINKTRKIGNTTQTKKRKKKKNQNSK